MLYVSGISLIFFGGIGHAYFIKHINSIPHRTWKWHAAQWLPLIIGALGCALVGAYLVDEIGRHNFFGYFGLFGVPIVIGGVGYVLGYHIFWRNEL